MSTIPDASGARYAPRGMVRALLRFAVLSGLVIAGWLVGSGVGHASEDLGQPGASLVQLASDPGDIVGPSDGQSDAHFGLPSTVASTVKNALSQASVPRLPVQPVDVLKPVLKPVVRAVAVPRPLTHVLATVSQPMSAPAQHSAGIRSQEPAHELAAAPPAAPAVRAAAVTAPVPVPAVTTVPATAVHAMPHTPVCAAAAPAEHPLAEEIALGGDPVAPMPTSPPDSATAPCMVGGAAGGGSTKGSGDFAVNESSTNASLASTHHLGYLSASDLPRSPAEQPSASPD
ncbi:MAG: hypothetical protein ACRDRO_13445 [Pseudonocardiaceae bacterium]